MGMLSRLLRNTTDNGLVFWCPGCDMSHRIQHGDGAGPRWCWNQDAERPTFTPSVLVRWHQWTPPATNDEVAAKIRSGEIVQTKVEKVCHTFVTDGRIQYLGDCTHALAGQTVDMVGFPADWGDD